MCLGGCCTLSKNEEELKVLVFTRVILTSPKTLSHPIRVCFLEQICSIYLFNVLLNDLLESYSCCKALKWMGRHNLREHAPYNQDESFV